MGAASSAKRGRSLPSESMSESTWVTISATASRAREVFRLAATPRARFPENPVGGNPMCLDEAASAFPINRGVREDRRADTLLDHQPDRLVVVELGLDLQLDRVAGEQGLHCRPQPVTEDQRGTAELVERHGLPRTRPGLVTSTISSSASRRRQDQTAARDLRQEADIDAPVDDKFLQPDRSGVNDFELDQRIVPPHPGKELRHDNRAQGRRDAEHDLAARMRLVARISSPARSTSRRMRWALSSSL